MPRTTLLCLSAIVIFTTLSCADNVEQAGQIDPEKPVFTIENNLEVMENTTVVGTMQAYDPVSSADVSFSIVPNKYDFDKFNIGNDGKTLKFIQPPDYENISQRSFSVQIEAKSKLGAVNTLDLKITITNDNDTAPIIDQNLANLSIAENQTTVTELTATDPDGDAAEITFLLSPPASAIPIGGEPGADQSLFEIININGSLTLAFVTPPDYEKSTTYNLTLYADDTNHISFIKIQIDLINVPVSSPDVTITAGVKRLLFNWQADPEVQYYELWEDADGSDGALSYKKIAANIPKDTPQYSLDIAVHNLNWLNTLYMIKACDQSGQNCIPSQELSPEHLMLDSIGNLKGNKIDSTDGFGDSFTISKDGNTIAFGAIGESSSFQGVCNSPSQPDQNSLITCSENKIYTDDGDAPSSGAVYIFTKNFAGDWFQKAIVKSKNSETGDNFGSKVSISRDGNLLAVGAPGEDGSSTIGSSTEPFKSDSTICADPAVNNVVEDNCAEDSGAVYIFRRNVDGLWSQEAYLKDGVADPATFFGRSVYLDGNGKRLVVAFNGKVLVFDYTAGKYEAPDIIKASNEPVAGAISDAFSAAVSISGDGDTIAIGAPYEDDSFTGICNGVDLPLSTGQGTCYGSTSTIVNDDLRSDSGAVYIYKRRRDINATTLSYIWIQEAFIKASNSELSTRFGYSVSLNDDGTVLAVGSPLENSAYEGVCNLQGLPDPFVLADPTQNSLCSGQNRIKRAGAVYLFKYFNDLKWVQQNYIKPANTGLQKIPEELFGDEFGTSVSISNDGKTLAVGSSKEDSTFSGVSYGPGASDANIYLETCKTYPLASTIENNCATDAGAVYVFSVDAQNQWQQQSFVKALTIPHQASENFGNVLSLSGDGSTLVVKTVNSVNLY